MNNLPLPTRFFKRSLKGCLKGFLFNASVIASIASLATLATLSGCGGSADQALPNSTGNTPLTVSNFTGLKGYTVGGSQVYSVIVKDPDGIASVSVTLDGVSVPVTNVGDVYSVTAPASLSVGTHSVIFSARGKSSDGTLEVPISEGINFTVYVSNTPLTISAVQGFAAYTLGVAQSYFADVVDPNGIQSVTATLNGQTIAVTKEGDRYTATIPANAPAGNNIIRFTGIGKQPSAVDEAPLSSQLAFVIYPNNTALVSGNIAGLTSYTVGGTQTYSLSPVDADGITSVTATLDGTAVALTTNGNTYSFATPTTLSVGNHAVSFTATGKQPNGAAEPPVTISQSISILNSNTALSISAISGALSYTAGTAQTYSANVLDPDGIVSVSATFDGSPIIVAPSGATYSVTLPVSVSVGSHTLQFSAIGKLPDGSSEVAKTVTQTIQVITSNTLLTISPINGLSSYAYGAAPTYSTSIVDPDGIGAVSATLDNQNIGVSVNGSSYSVVIPSVLNAGSHTLVFTATGKLPSGAAEASQTRSVNFTILPQNTPLTISAISGPATVPLNSIGTYSTTVVDPDGIAGVTAKIDNVTVNVTRNGSVYSVQTPAYSTGGQHVVEFAATGQIPGAQTESTIFISLGFGAQNANTPLTISAVNGPASVTAINPANISVIPNITYSVNVVDSDGIVSVGATINGQSVSVIVPTVGPTYSIQIPASAIGTFDIVFTAIGVFAGGNTETAQTQPFRATFVQPNSPLVFGSITTQDIVLGAGFLRVYSVDITDFDGIDSVTAVDSNGVPLPVTVSANPLTGANTVYSAQAYNGALQSGANVSVSFVRFTAVGLKPDGSLQPPQSIQ
jgi:hypothetical protein